jgi:hypothetical protein
VVLSDGGQSEGSPSGVADQSCERIRAPISAPPARKGEVIEGALGSGGCALTDADTNTLEPYHYGKVLYAKSLLRQTTPDCLDAPSGAIGCSRPGTIPSSHVTGDRCSGDSGRRPSVAPPVAGNSYESECLPATHVAPHMCAHVR